MAKIIDVLNKPFYQMSFEVFPPKRDTDFEKVRLATVNIGSLKPSFLSVTYGAGGGTSDNTLKVAVDVMEKCAIPILPHLTCISSTKQTVKERLEKMHEAGAENVMALRGDLTPELENADRSKLDYRYAVDLIRDIKESGCDFCIGGACYPEVHPESVNQRDDIRHLKEKVDAGCNFLTTQMIFDNDLFFSFLYKIREAGITVPVIPGIMPITTGKQVERALKLSGSFMPKRFRNLVDMFGQDPDAMKQAGIAYATDQIIDLYANGIRNVHVYTMNKPDVAEGIMSNVSRILGKPVGECDN